MAVYDGNNLKITKAPQDNSILPDVLSIIIGIIAFLINVGPRVLQTGNVAWLSKGDPATHYLGWLFFRNSDWSFPIGLNPRYGLEISNSILYSDSNPLLAIFFKLFSYFIPETFQYFGIWLLACFVLQAWFAFKLIGLLTKSPLVITLAASLFVFAPPMMFRLQVGHLSLAGHFLILAALYLALCPSLKRRLISWTVLLTVAAFTHAYLLALVGLIWAADILGGLIKRTVTFKDAMLAVSVGFGMTSLVCWQVGYFSVSDVGAEGFGFFRMNLLSILNPNGWSYMLRDIPGAAGEYEGFNYLGLGLIFLGFCSFPALLSAQTGVLHSAIKKPVLIVVMLALTAFALSNQIGIASVGFEFRLPDFLMRIANVFRASGRMFWPVFYLIYFAIIFLTVRGYSKHVAITVLGLALAIQIADTSKGWLNIRAKLMVRPSSAWETKMTDPFWNEAATKYTKVRLLKSENQSNWWQEVANYAGTHALATDAVYLARIGTHEQQFLQKKSRNALFHGIFDSDSLYILDDSDLHQVALSLDFESDLLAKVDGLNVIAPGWKKCVQCSNVLGEINISQHLPLGLKTRERLVFDRSNSGFKYLSSGWSSQEDSGIWSDGADAIIVLPLESAQITTIVVEANPFLRPSHPTQRVEGKIGGIATNSIMLNESSGSRFEIQISNEIRKQLKQSRILKLHLHFPDAARPSDFGTDSDSRKLAIRLVALTVQ